jgi:hypothetical protein
MGTTTKATTSRRPAPAAPRTSLADALFSTTQQRVLGLLFGQPGRSFYANELMALAVVQVRCSASLRGCRTVSL